MRTGAVALAHLGDDLKLIAAAEKISALTHADPEAGEACAIWCIAIDRAVRDGRLDGWWDALAHFPQHRRDLWSQRLQRAESSDPASFNPNGWVVAALQAAIAAIATTPVPTEMPCRHLADSLRTAVRIGDDTDTVAAIAGQLLGARWGATAVPATWRAGLRGWPGYTAADLTRLAVLSATGGAGDNIGWPATPDLRTHYRDFWPDPAWHAEVPGVAGLVVGNQAALDHVNADSYVTLCRIGHGQARGDDHLQVWLVDSPDLAANPNLDFVVDDTARHVAARLRAGRRVFLHCVAGASRTPTIAAAAVAELDGVSGRVALDKIAAAFPHCVPNPALLACLERIRP